MVGFETIKSRTSSSRVNSSWMPIRPLYPVLRQRRHSNPFEELVDLDSRPFEGAANAAEGGSYG